MWNPHPHAEIIRHHFSECLSVGGEFCLERSSCLSSPQEAIIDLTDLYTFHPVSNIPSLKNIVERVFGALLRALEEAYYRDPFHLRFKSGYSTETVLVSFVYDPLACSGLG